MPPAIPSFWAGAAGVAIALAVAWGSERRRRLHCARNDAGECAHCRATLPAGPGHRVSYRYSRTGPATDVAVCRSCFSRHRKRRLLFWVVFPVAAVLALLWLTALRY